MGLQWQVEFLSPELEEVTVIGEIFGGFQEEVRVLCPTEVALTNSPLLPPVQCTGAPPWEATQLTVQKR